MGTRSLELIDAAANILREIQPASVRAVCYRLFVAGITLHMGRSETNRVSRLLTLARENGTIPWEWIVDESREAETARRWSNAEAIIDAAVRGYRRDYWQDQGVHLEVWSEKGTVRGTLGQVLREYGVTFRVMHGYASATVVNDIAELSLVTDRQLVALYVGDWDPSGKHMSDVDLPRRLDEYGALVDLKRIALAEPDLAKLPSFDADSKRSDPRYRWFHQNVGGACYELDAMPPPELRRRVEHEIVRHIDMKKWIRAREVEAVEVESMRQFQRQWDDLHAE